MYCVQYIDFYSYSMRAGWIYDQDTILIFVGELVP
jgi:hypothetical protein